MKKMRTWIFAAVLSVLTVFFSSFLRAAEAIPHLKKKGDAAQLIVNGKPFLMLAGELQNSSSSSLEYMETVVWPKLQKLNLNTVLLPITWEQFEPQEGKFDYTLVDGLIKQARQNKMKLVFLWFASWKNSVSTYTPEWVKRDTVRFPRARGADNRNVKPVLATISPANRDADAKAFAALMHRIREIDAGENTVIMMQIENEVGIRPELRDMSEESDKQFASPVPKELMKYLAEHRDKLHPELLQRWEKGGFKTTGSWSDVFGGSPGADEVYSVWFQARYMNAVAAAGKKEYALPMFVNAWLADKPCSGSYPSGGPVAHMLDVWKAAAPAIDCLAPDIYFPDFKGVCESYSRNGNFLMVPEASRDESAAARAYWVFGKHHGICFSPFGIECSPEDHPLVDAYALLQQSIPLITGVQGTKRLTACYQQDDAVKEEVVPLGDWKLNVKYTHHCLQKNARPAALIVQGGKDEFYIIGQGCEVRFEAGTAGPRYCEIISVEMGRFEKNVFITELRLNGDETDSNNCARVPTNIFLDTSKPRILRVRVHRHD
ncbi:beta-galactosidase [Planctomycetales bacterium]|nr:beta-galactosidase [Planctomycetales bacterium]